MSRARFRSARGPTIEQTQAVPAPGAAPAAAGPAAIAVRAVPRRMPWSSEAATERLWLEEGFSPPLPDLEDFLAQAPPSFLCNSHRIAIALFVTMVVMAATLKVDIIVAGSGRLAVDSPTIVLQPMTLSVIRQIRVKPGDVVHKGDVLASLDPTFTQADRAALLAQQSAVRAQEERLQAELNGTRFEPAAGSPELDLQRTLFSQRQAQYAARLVDFDQRQDADTVEIAAAEQTRASIVQQLALSKEVEAMRNSLYRSQSGSKLVYLEAQSSRIRTERDLQAATAQVNATSQALRSIQAERQSYIDVWRRDLLESLVKTRAEAQAVDESLTKATRLNELVVLAAPADGTILEVGKRSVGSVLNPAEPLITMIPGDASLIAEVSIGSADVGYAKAGDDVVIKVDAFPYQRHGLLKGRLRSIGADSFGAGAPGTQGPAAGSAFHRGHVALLETTLSAMPEGAHLIPGMTVTAEIKVGVRSVLSYVLYPITRGISQSVREP